MSKTFPYSERLRRNATRLAIFTDEYGAEEFRTALEFDNKPVFFFDDGQYILARPAKLGGYSIEINGASIMQKPNIEDLEDVFFDLIRNIGLMIKNNVSSLKMPLPEDN